jgi:hypothetical protein
MTTDVNEYLRQYKTYTYNEASSNYNHPFHKYIRGNGGWSNWSHRILEKIVESSLMDPNKRKRWIDTLNPSLNAVLPYISYEERKEYVKSYHAANKEDIQQHKKTFYMKNKEVIKETVRTYQLANKVKISETKRLYRMKNKDMIKEKRKLKYAEKKCLNINILASVVLTE